MAVREGPGSQVGVGVWVGKVPASTLSVTGGMTQAHWACGGRPGPATLWLLSRARVANVHSSLLSRLLASPAVNDWRGGCVAPPWGCPRLPHRPQSRFRSQSCPRRHWYCWWSVCVPPGLVPHPVLGLPPRLLLLVTWAGVGAAPDVPQVAAPPHTAPPAPFPQTPLAPGIPLDNCIPPPHPDRPHCPHYCWRWVGGSPGGQGNGMGLRAGRPPHCPRWVLGAG